MNSKIKILVGILAVGIVLLSGCVEKPPVTTSTTIQASTITSPMTTTTTIPEKEVTITTDKTEYRQGEIVKIDIKNNLDKNVYFFDRMIGNRIRSSGITIYRDYRTVYTKNEKNRWEGLVINPGVEVCRNLSANDSIYSSWDQRYFTLLADPRGGQWVPTKASPGRYKVEFCYYVEKNCSGKIECVEEEFTIERGYYERAEEYFMRGDYEKALEYAQKAKEDYLEIKDFLGVFKCDELISKINEKL